MNNNKTKTMNTGHPSVALIGCGAIAESLYLPALADIPHVMEKLILVDNSPERASAMAKKFNAGSVKSDYHEILGAVDGAIVAVPHHLHHAIARDFLAAGAHVLCEKPLSETADEVRDLIAIARNNNVTISVNNTRRLVPNSVKVKELIAQGAIGKLRSISYLEGSEFDWPTASGFYSAANTSRKGIMLDLGAHIFDVISFWLGAKPRLVSAECDSFGGVEAVAAVTLEHDGCVCTIRMSHLSRLPNSFRITGERGWIGGEIHNVGTITLATSAGKQTIHARTHPDESPLFNRKPIAAFFGLLHNTGEPVVAAHDVLPSIELIEEAYARATRFPMPWYENAEVVHES
jgi:predicted dehydrogenase